MASTLYASWDARSTSRLTLAPPYRDALLAALPGMFGDEDTVLVKGSRGAAMESVLQGLLASNGRGEG